jgi:hypothetical protein
MTECVSPIKAEVARFTLLDECGVPITGSGSAQITVDAFTQITNTPNYEEGQRFLLRKANGAPCVNQRDPGFFNWVEQVTTLCTIDPDLLAVITGDTLLVGSGEAPSNFELGEGIGVAFGEGLLTARFSKEVWQPVSGEGACDPSGQQRFVYWAFPNEGDAQLQAFNFENDVFTMGFRSITRQASSLWDLGDAWLDGNPASSWGPGKHFAFAVTTVAPPEASCGAVEFGS